MRIALFQPDIPQNLGAMMRLCACMGVGLDVIEPCGFPFNDRKIKKAGMDYQALATLKRYDNWGAFKDQDDIGRVVLMTTKTDIGYLDFEFRDNDILLAGQESAGVPDFIHEQVDACITIPMHGIARSLNIVNATSMILGEALRQVRV